MRKLKVTVRRKTLNQMYVSFLSPTSCELFPPVLTVYL